MEKKLRNWHIEKSYVVYKWRLDGSNKEASDAEGQPPNIAIILGLVSS
jgi:hypothetical protein